MSDILILPTAVLHNFPVSLVKIIISYLPKIQKKEVSPSLQKQLTKIQSMTLKGKSSMYLKDFEDFCLD